MIFADYIKDANRAYAAELLNANATTVEEMMAAIHEANNMMLKFSGIRDDWFDICYDYDNAVINLNETKAKLERMMEFKNSKVASLIAKYIENHTPELLKEIKAEIEATNNPFEITIYEGCVDFDWSDCYFDKFYIDTIYTFYTSKHRYYLDEDIERCKRQIKWETENKEKYEKLKEEMLAKYGDCLLEINLKEIGGVSLDKWKRAFANAVSIAIEQDYFSDILFFDLYPDIQEEVDKIWYEDTSDTAREEAIQNLYDEKWGYVNEAFNEIFGFKR